MKPLPHILALLSLAAPALHAQAAVTLYTNEAAYTAAVGATRTFIDFAGSGATVAGGSFSSNVGFGSCTNPAAFFSCGVNVFHNGGGITDLGGSAAANGVSAVGWTFSPPPVYAFSFTPGGGQVAALWLYTPSLALQVVDTSAATNFIGLVSDAPLFRVIGQNGTVPTGNDRYFVDNFRINEALAPIPEPASWALMLAGCGLLGAAVRRKVGQQG